MRHVLRGSLVPLLTALTVGVTSAAPAGAAARPLVVVPSPVSGMTDDPISGGIVATSPNDAWAVGRVMIHWDGTSWTQIGTPPSDGDLWAVTATAADNVWAVGSVSGDNGLVEHWDGTSWNVMPAPAGATTLGSVAVDHNGDVWAAQFDSNVLYEWNGAVWRTQHPSGIAWGLPGLAAPLTGAGVIVASADSTSSPNVQLGVWDHAAWADQLPLDTVQGALEGVAAGSRGGVWAVGETDPTASGLWLHWNGASWTSGTVQGKPGTTMSFLAVAAGSGGSVWAAGTSHVTGTHRNRAVIYRGTGSPSKNQPLPPGVARNLSLGSIATIPGDPGGVWAVGLNDAANAPVILLRQ